MNTSKPLEFYIQRIKPAHVPTPNFDLSRFNWGTNKITKTYVPVTEVLEAHKRAKDTVESAFVDEIEEFIPDEFLLSPTLDTDVEEIQHIKDAIDNLPPTHSVKHVVTQILFEHSLKKLRAPDVDMVFSGIKNNPAIGVTLSENSTTLHLGNDKPVSIADEDVVEIAGQKVLLPLIRPRFKASKQLMAEVTKRFSVFMKQTIPDYKKLVEFLVVVVPWIRESDPDYLYAINDSRGLLTRNETSRHYIKLALFRALVDLPDIHCVALLDPSPSDRRFFSEINKHLYKEYNRTISVVAYSDDLSPSSEMLILKVPLHHHLGSFYSCNEFSSSFEDQFERVLLLSYGKGIEKHFGTTVFSFGFNKLPMRIEPYWSVLNKKVLHRYPNPVRSTVRVYVHTPHRLRNLTVVLPDRGKRLRSTFAITDTKLSGSPTSHVYNAIYYSLLRCAKGLPHDESRKTIENMLHMLLNEKPGFITEKTVSRFMTSYTKGFTVTFVDTRVSVRKAVTRVETSIINLFVQAVPIGYANAVPGYKINFRQTGVVNSVILAKTIMRGLVKERVMNSYVKYYRPDNEVEVFTEKLPPRSGVIITDGYHVFGNMTADEFVTVDNVTHTVDKLLNPVRRDKLSSSIIHTTHESHSAQRNLKTKLAAHGSPKKTRKKPRPRKTNTIHKKPPRPVRRKPNRYRRVARNSNV